MVQSSNFDDQVNRAIVPKVGKDAEAFTPEPDGEGECKRQGRRIAEQVQLIRFATASHAFLFRDGCFAEEPFGDNILSDEENGTGKS